MKTRKMIKDNELRSGCNECGWIFNPAGAQKLIPIGDTAEETRKREFDQHDCAAYTNRKANNVREDANQAAARTIREATERA